MKKWLSILFLSLYTLQASAPDPLLMPPDDHLKIVVNNRVLTIIHGKPITVIDVLKRMDMLFLRQYPEYTSSVNARFQFYQANWKRTLNDLIDKELILADAEEIKMEVPQADVRQEMEDLFGPNIIVSLDKTGLSLDEAMKMVQGDIVLRRMVYLKVTSKALGKVTPQATRELYEEYVKENTRLPAYHYRMVTLREKDPIKGKIDIDSLYAELKKDPTKITEIVKGYKNVNLSELFKHNEKEIAPANKDILLKLKVGNLSDPISQKSRTDNSLVYRLFYLEGYDEGKPLAYAEVEAELKEDLLNKYMGQEQSSYLKRLRRHYAFQESNLKESISDDFTPFILQ